LIASLNILTICSNIYDRLHGIVNRASQWRAMHSAVDVSLRLLWNRRISARWQCTFSIRSNGDSARLDLLHRDEAARLVLATRATFVSGAALSEIPAKHASMPLAAGWSFPYSAYQGSSVLDNTAGARSGQRGMLGTHLRCADAIRLAFARPYKGQ
jgi:hypothetical protein